MVAAIIGLLLGLVIGAGCRFFDIPSPGAPASDWSRHTACNDRWLCHRRPSAAAGENAGTDEQSMKPLIGIVLAFALGFACRAFGIPSPAPP